MLITFHSRVSARLSRLARWLSVLGIFSLLIMGMELPEIVLAVWGCVLALWLGVAFFDRWARGFLSLPTGK